MSMSVVAVPSPSSAVKRRRQKEEVYRLAYINCIKPTPFRNTQNLPADGYLEEKSIADLMVQAKAASGAAHENPYEVVRKPPKKRKKVDDKCFMYENKALNLATPEKQFNPYEVKRLPKQLTDNFEKENHSFVNLALNLKAPEHSVQNPYEVVRPSEVTVTSGPAKMPVATSNHINSCGGGEGIVNMAMDIQQQPQQVQKPFPICAIAVPFTPTINHRIDFGQMKTPEPPKRQQQEEEQALPEPLLTPSDMLAKKLVFSPKEANCGTPKRLFRKSLSTISEEVAVDIDEELDCYQLQLENSINEAKVNNRKYFTDIRKDVLKTQTKKAVTRTEETKVTVSTFECKKKSMEEGKSGEERDDVDEETEDDVDGEDSFDDDLRISDGNYQPFKRAYTRPTASQPSRASSLMPPPPVMPQLNQEKLNSDKGSSITGMIRRSIRKITKPKAKHSTSQDSLETVASGSSQTSTDSKPVGTSIMASIRQSLRKRRVKEGEQEPSAVVDHDMSIIGEEGTRTVFRANTEEIFNRKENLLRRSTRGVKKIFNKGDGGYILD